jgi:DNA-binding LytR/AlgR family response regulator
MNILIVENEIPAADRLVKLLGSIDRTITVTGILETVEGAVTSLQEGPAPDLILMDIQLDDGLCFEIFETIKVDTPVIFTTAFDEYTLRAFKVNSIDYLLKPVDRESLRSALNKFKKLYADQSPFRNDFRQLMREFKNQYKTRFLIKIGDKFRSLAIKDVSYFHISEKSTYARDNQGKDYGLDYSLEQLQGVIDPRRFFRINRDCIVNIESVTLMSSFSSSRLQLILKNEAKSELFVVSRDKVSAFKSWVDR